MKSKDLKLINSLRHLLDYIYYEEYDDWVESGFSKNHIGYHIQILEIHCQSLEKELNGIERKTIEDFL